MTHELALTFCTCYDLLPSGITMNNELHAHTHFDSVVCLALPFEFLCLLHYVGLAL